MNHLYLHLHCKALDLSLVWCLVTDFWHAWWGGRVGKRWKAWLLTPYGYCEGARYEDFLWNIGSSCFFPPLNEAQKLDTSPSCFSIYKIINFKYCSMLILLFSNGMTCDWCLNYHCRHPNVNNYICLRVWVIKPKWSTETLVLNAFEYNFLKLSFI